MVIRPSVLICTEFPWATCLQAQTISQSLPLFCSESGCFLSKAPGEAVLHFTSAFELELSQWESSGSSQLLTSHAKLHHNMVLLSRNPPPSACLVTAWLPKSRFQRNPRHTPPDEPTASWSSLLSNETPLLSDSFCFANRYWEPSFRQLLIQLMWALFSLHCANFLISVTRY